MTLNTSGNDLHRGKGGAMVVVDASSCGRVKNAPDGRFHAPPDMQAFVQSKTVTEVARALGMSRRTAHRLRKGYWPHDTRSILAYWEAFKGRSAQQQSGWFLRRVYTGGLVRHAGLDWTAPGLAVRTGQQLAVARSSGGLLAQTLELPPQRLALMPMSAKEDAA